MVPANVPIYNILEAKPWYTDADGLQCRIVLCEIQNHPSDYSYGTFIQVKDERFHDPMMSGHFYYDFDKARSDFIKRS